MAELIKGKTFSDKPWYYSYCGMMNRCYNSKVANYEYYGGRGISVCEEWHDIEEFEKWVFSSGYEKGLTLDRIDANGNYEPSNCRWATPKEQANNRRNTLYIEYEGESHTISEWAEIKGLNPKTINGRYYRGIRGAKLFEKPFDCTGKTWVMVNGRREWKECV